MWNIKNENIKFTFPLHAISPLGARVFHLLYKFKCLKEKVKWEDGRDWIQTYTVLLAVENTKRAGRGCGGGPGNEDKSVILGFYIYIKQNFKSCPGK